MKRRDFIVALGGAAVMPMAAWAQQSAMPVVGFLSGRSLASDADLVAAFRCALSESGLVESQNITIEFRWADGRLDQLPALAAELIERKVAVLFAAPPNLLAAASGWRLQSSRSYSPPVVILSPLTSLQASTDRW